MQKEDQIKEAIPAKYASFILLIIVILSCIPIWIWKYAPLVDYPMHVARAYLLSLPQNGSGITEFYQSHIQPVPNLGMDLLVSRLMHFVPPLIAGKLFLCLVIALILTGGFALAKQIHGKVTIACYLPALALFDQWFIMGFANYLFGMGLALWAIVVWLRSADWPVIRRVAILACCSIILIVCHLMSFLVAVGIILAMSIKGTKKLSRLQIVSFLSLGVCGLAYLGLTLLHKTPVEWNGRLETWTNMFLVNPSLCLGIILPIALLKLGVKGELLSPIIGLLVFALFGPSFLGGTAFACDRLTLPLTILCLVAFNPKTSKSEIVSAWSAACLLVAGLVQVTILGTARSNQTEELMQALRQVPDRSTLATIDMTTKKQRTIDDHRHVSDWILIEKPLFVAQNFAKKLQQPMVFAPQYENWHRFQNNNPIKVDTQKSFKATLNTMNRLQTELNQVRKSQSIDSSKLFVLIIHPKPDWIANSPIATSISTKDSQYQLISFSD